MVKRIEEIRGSVNSLIRTLDLGEIAVIPTSRKLIAVIDQKFEMPVQLQRWYAVFSRGDHVYAVADIDGRRISLQRYVLKLEHPERSYDELKHVSFANKQSLDCRLSNLEYRIGRQSVMRNRKPKKGTSSRYKGVIKSSNANGCFKWRTQIKGNLGTMSIGTYDDEQWAATVYDAAAYLIFGGSAYYNFPETCPNVDALEIARVRIERFSLMKKRKQAAKD